MAQYDLLMTQNVAPSGIEFSEKYINIAKGGLLSAATGGVPTVLAGGSDGFHLIRDDAEATGLKWVAVTGGHTQNTDTGTTSNTFEVSSDGTAGSILFDGAQAGGDFETKVQNQTQTGNIILTLPAVTGTLATQSYADGLFAANDAMIFKGTIGTGGTHTIAAFNALTTYNAGWTYRVVEAGTIRGKVCEIGDIIMVLVDRTGSGNVDADFTAQQTNLDGAVIGPASTTDNYVALFSGTTGKLLKAGSGALGSGAYAAAYVHPTTTGNIHVPTGGATTQILQWSSDGTAKWVTVSSDLAIADNGAATIASGAVTLAKMANLSANSIIGNNTGSAAVPAALTGTQVINMIWQTAPATKTSTGTLGMIAKDDNFVYFCTATNIWKRSPIATNW